MRVALIGVGLIGASAVAAWRGRGRVDEAIGYDVNAAAAAAAVARGFIDRSAASVGEAVAAADLVLVAVPVGAVHDVLVQAANALPAHSIVTDVGSTKRSVVDAAHAALSSGSRFSLRRFVPGHPIAGSERPGVDAADPGLFRGRWFVSTPTEQTDPEALATVESLWREAGARVHRMDIDEHDRVFAAVSHLPHLLAFALVAQVAASGEGERRFAFAGAGFRDFTRIAASSPQMWRDIALANRAALGAELRAFRRRLDELQAALDSGDRGRLESEFTVASDARRRLPVGTPVDEGSA